ncbi:MAG: M13 family metallopeptidase [Flavobacterium sp.]
MPKTKKRSRQQHRHNKTHKQCPISLKPFEAEFSKALVVKEGKQTRSIETLKKQAFAKQLMSRFSPSHITPHDNFYDYINYVWLKNIRLEHQQKYIVQVDDFRLTQHRVYEQLNDIIVDYYKHHQNKLATNLQHYYHSVIYMNPKPYSRTLAREAVELVDEFIRQDNPWALLAHINSDEMLAANAPFMWSMNPDDKEPDVYRCYITPMQFILLDLDILYDDATDIAYKQKYRNGFFKIAKQVFNVLLGKNTLNAKDVFDVQTQVFSALGCSDVSKQEKTYNKVMANEALEKYGFDWPEFARCLGFKRVPPFFITSSLNYLKCGSTLLLDNWKTPKWRTFWIYLLVRRLARITKDWETIIYDFHGKFERGQEVINKSDSVSSVLYMTIPFNTFLTNEYVAKYEDPAAMEYTKTLCNDLKVVFRRILERNTWLQPSTKRYALKKLDHFKFIYGKPDKLREDPDLNYTDVLYDNMKKINDWRHQKFIELEGRPVIDIPMVDWNTYPVKMVGTQAYIVNASYTPSKNAIYINLGYIQKPFIDLSERGIEYNLAHLGFTIGHEMSHGFDDWGSQYGYDGKLLDWWTAKDKQKYKEMQKDVIRQYEEFAARDGIQFDATSSVGEDLADISGIAICDEYLRDFQDNNRDIIPIRALSYEGFYTYFAYQQKQFVGKKAISAQLKTNPHPLDKYRCNIPLSRSSIFRALFNVKRGDGMWWHNMNTIW